MNANNSKGRFVSYISIFFILLPRVATTYPFFLVASIILLDCKSKDQVHKFIKLVFLVIVFFLIQLVLNDISNASFILEFALCIPLLMYCSGFNVKLDPDQSLKTIRLVNVFVFILSMLNMTKFGFPIKLPYLDFLPDAYAALYGLGGAKIVTIIGFFGVAAEISVNRVKSKNENIYLLISMVNFVVPSYIIGVIVGLISFALTYIRKASINIFVGLILLIVFTYIFNRIESIDSTILYEFGFHPKILAYLLLPNLYGEYPSTFLFGTGLGQFSSTAALWASDYISSISSHNIPELPGLFMTQFHDSILGPILSSLFYNFWSLSSSANKPYSSISTILAEYGFILGLIVIYLVLNRLIIVFKRTNNQAAVLLFLFTLGLFFLDSWHDNPWFFYCLFITEGVFNNDYEQT